MIKFMNTIKQYRFSQGMSQAKLSEITGTHHTSIRKYEKGLKIPNLLTVLKLCKGLGVDLAIISKK